MHGVCDEGGGDLDPTRSGAGEDGRAFALLLCCFFVSGLAALIYQTAWARAFAFVFGTSELAIATVLAAYMGGLAAGAAVAARMAPRIGRPVLAYFSPIHYCIIISIFYLWER